MSSRFFYKSQSMCLISLLQVHHLYTRSFWKLWSLYLKRFLWPRRYRHHSSSLLPVCLWGTFIASTKPPSISSNRTIGDDCHSHKFGPIRTINPRVIELSVKNQVLLSHHQQTLCQPRAVWRPWHQGIRVHLDADNGGDKWPKVLPPKTNPTFPYPGHLERHCFRLSNGKAMRAQHEKIGWIWIQATTRLIARACKCAWTNTPKERVIQSSYKCFVSCSCCAKYCAKYCSNRGIGNMARSYKICIPLTLVIRFSRVNQGCSHGLWSLYRFVHSHYKVTRMGIFQV